MKRFILLIFLMSIMIGMGCEDNKTVTISEKQKNEFSGFVIDSLTLKPLDSVYISFIDTIGNPYTYSDSFGQFGDIYLGGGEIDIIAQKDGYFTKSIQVDLQSNPDSILFELVKQ